MVAKAMDMKAHINNSKATAATTSSNSTLQRRPTVSLNTTSMVRDTVPTLSNR